MSVSQAPSSDVVANLARYRRAANYIAAAMIYLQDNHLPAAACWTASAALSKAVFSGAATSCGAWRSKVAKGTAPRPSFSSSGKAWGCSRALARPSSK